MAIYLMKTTAQSPERDDDGNPYPVGTVINRIVLDDPAGFPAGPYRLELDDVGTRQVVPVSTKPRAISKMEFANLLKSIGGMSDENLIAGWTDPNLTALNFWLSQATEVLLDDPDGRTRAGLAGMVALGHLTADGEAAVIAGWPTA